MTQNLHILFCKDQAIEVSDKPFNLPAYGDKTSLRQMLYSPAHESSPELSYTDVWDKAYAQGLKEGLDKLNTVWQGVTIFGTNADERPLVRVNHDGTVEVALINAIIVAETAQERYKVIDTQEAPQPAQDEREAVSLEAYDAGYLNDYGYGNVGWWHDYLRAELGRAHDHYEQQVRALREDTSNNKKLTPVYLFRRKGMKDFITCSEERYVELFDNEQFEVKVLFDRSW